MDLQLLLILLILEKFLSIFRSSFHTLVVINIFKFSEKLKNKIYHITEFYNNCKIAFSGEPLLNF